MKQYYLYILTNKNNTTLYTGITSDLKKRIWEHHQNTKKSFTSKYNLHKLVYFEVFEDPENAIKREKRIKFWKRQWKEDLINKDYPKWNDLYNQICA